VGPREALATRLVRLRDVNWIGDGELSDIPPSGLEVCVRLRSTRPPAPAILFAADGEAFVELMNGEDGVSPGQACVFYENAGPLARVLGGGFIKATEPARGAG
jgi:tRNA-specific 2-thiouridylase